MSKTRKEIYLEVVNAMIQFGLQELKDEKFDTDNFEIEIKIRNLEFDEDVKIVW